MLQFRVEELEARLGRLEDVIRRLRAEHPERPSVEAGAGRGADPDREGARLVVIEMVTAGYTREQIAGYLRQTFAVEDPEALLAEVGPVAG